MSNPDVDAIVDRYFDELDRALAALSPSERQQLLDDIRGHVAEERAGLEDEREVDVRQILDRVGRPEDIATEALEDRRPARLLGFSLGISLVTRRRFVRIAVPVIALIAVAVILAVVLPGSAPPVRAETTAPIASIGGFPTGAAVDPATDTLYVGDGGSTLSVLNATTCNAVTTSGCAVHAAQTGGSDPIGVAVDDRTGTVYVVNGGSNTVAVIKRPDLQREGHDGVFKDAAADQCARWSGVPCRQSNDGHHLCRRHRFRCRQHDRRSNL